jgi:hypothetical protein
MPFFFALSKASEFGVTPAAYVSEGFPALDPTAAFVPGNSLRDLRFKSPYYQQWNISVQRDIGWNTLLEVAYVGSKGTHLQVLRDYNQPQPGPGDPQERRPYPQYGNFGSITNAGSSTYNSLQLKLNKRWSKGVWLLTAFTYGKAYNDQPEICCASPWPPDSYNIRGERGPADYDQRYRSVTSFAWDLPFGMGRRFLDKGGRGRRDLRRLAGWRDRDDRRRLSVFARYQPRHVEHRHVRSASARPNRRSRLLPTPAPRAGTTPRHTAPRPSSPSATRGATASWGRGRERRISTCGRASEIGDRARVEFRIEAFNAFNHPNFGLPDNYVDDGESAGTITYTALSQRQIQIGARLGF